MAVSKIEFSPRHERQAQFIVQTKDSFDATVTYPLWAFSFADNIYVQLQSISSTFPFEPWRNMWFDLKDAFSLLFAQKVYVDVFMFGMIGTTDYIQWRLRIYLSLTEPHIKCVRYLYKTGVETNFEDPTFMYPFYLLKNTAESAQIVGSVSGWPTTTITAKYMKAYFYEPPKDGSWATMSGNWPVTTSLTDMKVRVVPLVGTIYDETKAVMINAKDTVTGSIMYSIYGLPFSSTTIAGPAVEEQFQAVLVINPTSTQLAETYSLPQANYYSHFTSLFAYATFTDGGTFADQTMSYLPFSFNVKYYETYGPTNATTGELIVGFPRIPTVLTYQAKFVSKDRSHKACAKNVNNFVVTLRSIYDNKVPSDIDQNLTYTFVFFDAASEIASYFTCNGKRMLLPSRLSS